MAENKGNGLQSKTKAELIDIILRKDALHRTLCENMTKQDKSLKVMQEDIENLQKEIDNNVETINKLQKEITDKENIIDDFKEGFDNQAYDIIGYNKSIKCHYMIEIIFMIIILMLAFRF